MFESSLIDLETKNQPRGRRWLSLPIAVALHLVGIAAFAFASYWTVSVVPEPSLNVVFLSLTPPPAPGGGGGGGRPKPLKPIEKAATPVKPAQPVQPTTETVPEDVPTPATTPAVEDAMPDLASGADSTGDDLPPGPGFGHGEGPGVGPGPGGDDGGDDGGDGPGIGAADDQPLRFTVGMTRPEVIHQVQPRYTEGARQAGVQGAVIVEATINQQGNVENVRVLRGLPMGLDKAAIEAIQQWRFKPATMGGNPVKVFFTLTVNFTIQR